jgi:hypothetical protein
MPDAAFRRLEESNLRQIEMLNQRGGRTLSIVDLMEAGTITAEAAGYLLWRVAHGASFLTGAVPGGAGKSTLLADLLGMLPPGERIVTTPDTSAVRDALRDNDRSGNCYLCHEIGSGMWYGYLWGDTVADFFQLTAGGGRIAACLHADDPAQMREILVSRELGVTDDAFACVGLLLFMGFARGSLRSVRRVNSIWTSDASGAHKLAFEHDPDADRLRLCDSLHSDGVEDGPPELGACQAFMRELEGGSRTLFEDVREATITFYERECGA